MLFKVSDVLGEIIMVGGAALHNTRVTRARVTVTGLVTGASMTGTPAAVATWSAGATTASSLEHSTMRRMTAARSLD